MPENGADDPPSWVVLTKTRERSNLIASSTGKALISPALEASQQTFQSTPSDTGWMIDHGSML